MCSVVFYVIHHLSTYTNPFSAHTHTRITCVIRYDTPVLDVRKTGDGTQWAVKSKTVKSKSAQKTAQNVQNGETDGSKETKGTAETKETQKAQETQDRSEQDNKDTTELFDYVAVCNGHYNVPFMPGDDQVPGISSFQGLAIHSCKYV